MELRYDLDKQKFIGMETLEEILQGASEENFSIALIGHNLDDIVEKADKVKQHFAGLDINYSLNLKLPQNYIYDQKDVEKLVDIDNYCQVHDNAFKVSLNDGKSKEASGTLKNLLFARNEIETLKNKVNNFKYFEKGKEVSLSTYEKFIVAYKFVANRVYNIDEDFNNPNMRNWVGVLSGEHVICSGFSSLLKCVCDQIFEPEELKCYHQSCTCYDDDKTSDGHANNIVIINDPKYNLNGVYYADACWDSLDEIKGANTTYNFCLIPVTQIFDYKYCKFGFDNHCVIYKNLPTVKNPYAEKLTSLCMFGKKMLNEDELTSDLLTKFGYKTHPELRAEAESVIKETAVSLHEKEKIYQEFDNKFDKQVDELLETQEDFIYTKQIDDKIFASGLKAVAKFVGYDEEKIPEFIETEVEKRKKYYARDFGLNNIQNLEKDLIV